MIRELLRYFALHHALYNFISKTVKQTIVIYNIHIHSIKMQQQQLQPYEKRKEKEITSYYFLRKEIKRGKRAETLFYKTIQI